MQAWRTVARRFRFSRAVPAPGPPWLFPAVSCRRQLHTAPTRLRHRSPVLAQSSCLRVPSCRTARVPAPSRRMSSRDGLLRRAPPDKRADARISTGCAKTFITPRSLGASQCFFLIVSEVFLRSVARTGRFRGPPGQRQPPRESPPTLLSPSGPPRRRPSQAARPPPG